MRKLSDLFELKFVEKLTANCKVLSRMREERQFTSKEIMLIRPAN